MKKELEMTMTGELTFFRGLQNKQTNESFFIINPSMQIIFSRSLVRALRNHVPLPLPRLIKMVIAYHLMKRSIEL